MAKRDRSVAWVWYFFASKLLLFAVHLATIFFGVIKVCWRTFTFKVSSSDIVLTTSVGRLVA